MLEFESLSLDYIDTDPPTRVFDRLAFKVNEGEIVTLLGKNGAGKTTLLNFIAGFYKKKLVGNVDLSSWRKSVKIGFVRQNSQATIYPWISPLENIVYPLTYNKAPETYKKAKLLCDAFRLNCNFGILAGELSGGQKQRLSIIKEIFAIPDIMLIDEGFSSIDFKDRLELIVKIREFLKRNKTAGINISHHLLEAVLFSDRILGLNDQQIDLNVTVDLSEQRKPSMRSYDEVRQLIDNLNDYLLG